MKEAKRRSKKIPYLLYVCPPLAYRKRLLPHYVLHWVPGRQFSTWQVATQPAVLKSCWLSRSQFAVPGTTLVVRFSRWSLGSSTMLRLSTPRHQPKSHPTSFELFIQNYPISTLYHYHTIGLLLPYNLLLHLLRFLLL